MRTIRSAAALGAACITLWASQAAAAAPVTLIPPVDAAVARPFEQPDSDYGAGHRGVDYAVDPGTPVRAAAAGTVRFAGPVAGTLAVSIAHAGDVVTTYTDLNEVHVAAGTPVGQGHWIGLAGSAHRGGAPGLHFGVKVAGAYVDPRSLMAPIDLGRALHLAPLAATYSGDLPPGRAAALRYRHDAACTTAAPSRRSPPAPNDNVVVVLAGISSETVRGGLPELYGSYASTALGYPPGRVYEFSYRGAAGARLHRPYRHSDTYGDIEAAGRRLRDLLQRIARRHPGRDVDLVAHSQGGIVARAMLASAGGGLPRVQHLVTLASPHAGTPAADLASATRVSPLGRVARAGWAVAARLLPIPPPGARSVEQLRTGSRLVETLAAEDVAFGTRVLTLAMAHDLVVPAGRASVAHETNTVLAPEGVWGHSSILRSDRARSLAYGFLRDGPEGCGSAGASAAWWQRAAGGLWTGLSALLGG